MGKADRTGKKPKEESDMSSYHEKEALCEAKFRELGECHHLWTPEDHEIIFTKQLDFQTGMTLLGIAALLHPDISILTFQLMSNHIHITASGKKERILHLFETFKNLVQRWLKAEGRCSSLDRFQANTRNLLTLEDVRNVIAYDNRNGFVVSPTHTPFTYPWGANRYYYSPDSCRLAELECKPTSLRGRRIASHSRLADDATGLMLFENYALPLSFCDIHTGEALFRDASHYFYKLSRSIENNSKIAKEIGENIWYTDEELYNTVTRICRERYKADSPATLAAQDKISLAKSLYYDYNASAKQIQRMLRINASILTALGWGMQ